MEFKLTHIANPYPVQARKIVNVIGNVAGGAVNAQLDDGTTFVIDSAMTARRFPLQGDFLVVGEDGYAYINPAELFDRNYKPVGVVTAESIMTADLVEDGPVPRFADGQAVLFQSMLTRIGSVQEYHGAVLARIHTGYVDHGTPPRVRYDIELRGEDADGEYWTPLCGVDSMMVLPMPDEAVSEAGAPQIQGLDDWQTLAFREPDHVRRERDQFDMRRSALSASIELHRGCIEPDQVVEAAARFAAFLAGEMAPVKA